MVETFCYFHYVSLFDYVYRLIVHCRCLSFFVGFFFVHILDIRSLDEENFLLLTITMSSFSPTSIDEALAKIYGDVTLSFSMYLRVLLPHFLMKNL